MSSELPILTVGIVSFNRLKYLRVLIRSLRECLDHPSVEYLLADGGSWESGHLEYRERLEGFRVRSVSEPHADSANWILRNARGRYLLLLPEDIQFLRKGPWVRDCLELLDAKPNAGMVVFDAQRRQTIREQLMERPLRIRHRRVPLFRLPRRPHHFVGSTGEEFFSAGDSRDGISTAGIMSLSRMDLWRKIGPFRATKRVGNSPDNDSSLGAEDEMIQRIRTHPEFSKLEAYLMKHPAAADIITDPRGTKAKIRMGNRRYGRYADPAVGDYYYCLRPAEVRPPPPHPFPVWSFEEWVKPVGWTLPLDDARGLRKTSVLTDGEPWESVE